MYRGLGGSPVSDEVYQVTTRCSIRWCKDPKLTISRTTKIYVKWQNV